MGKPIDVRMGIAEVKVYCAQTPRGVGVLSLFYR